MIDLDAIGHYRARKVLMRTRALVVVVAVAVGCDGSIDLGSGDAGGGGGAAGADAGPDTYVPCGSPGYIDCDNDPSNGCETASRADPNNCGYCSHVCAAGDGAAPVCTNGMCAPGGCPGGKADCDGDPGNGCETDIATDVAHCGSCTNVCSFPQAIPACQGGMCSFVCAAGHADCDKIGNNGCEVDLNTSAQHCGSCANVCPAPASAVADCKAGVCSFACAAGAADCDGKVADGCETPIATDPKNCGACGHDCLGAACNSGVCAPATVANSLNRPVAVVIDATRVFWTDMFDGYLQEIGKAGGSSTTLADFGASDELAISSDSANLVWYSLVNIMTIPTAGGKPSVVSSQGDLKGIAVDADTVYFLKEGTWSGTYNKDGSVNKLSMQGGAVTQLAAGQDWPVAIAVDNDHVFWVAQGTVAGTGRIVRIPKTGGVLEELASQQSAPCGLALNASSIFWRTNCNEAVPGPGALMRAPKSGGAAGQLVASTDGSKYLAADDAYVYWTFAGYNKDQSTGQVLKVSIGNPAGPIVLASNQNHPRGLALDSTRVYWANAGSGTDMNPSGDGSIRAVAK
jgi:hypothetical protein